MRDCLSHAKQQKGHTGAHDFSEMGGTQCNYLCSATIESKSMRTVGVASQCFLVLDIQCIIMIVQFCGWK